MKWLAWAVLILAGTATYYLVIQGSPSSPKKAEYSRDQPPPDEDEPGKAPSGPDEVIQPTPRAGEEVELDAGGTPKDTKDALEKEKEGSGKIPRIDNDKESNREMGTLEGSPRRDRYATTSTRPPAARPPVARNSEETSAPSAPSALSQGTSAAGGLPGTPFGAFPTGGLPASGLSPSRQGVTTSPGSSTAGPPRTNPSGPQIARAPTGSPTPQMETREKTNITPKSDGGEGVKDETAQQPMMWSPNSQSGLVLDPPTITLETNTTGGATSRPMIAAFSFKSAFDPQAKPTVQILRECPLVLNAANAVGCDPAALPSGGPSIASYVSGTSVLKDDLLPETKEFDIGTVAVGSYLNLDTGRETPITEVNFAIDPGTSPGRYLVRLRSQDKTLESPFEVLAPATPPGTP